MPGTRVPHHLKAGAAHARTQVLAIVDQAEVTVALETSELLSSHRIEPARGYWAQHTEGPRPMSEVVAGARPEVSEFRR